MKFDVFSEGLLSSDGLTHRLWSHYILDVFYFVMVHEAGAPFQPARPAWTDRHLIAIKNHAAFYNCCAALRGETQQGTNRRNHLCMWIWEESNTATDVTQDLCLSVRVVTRASCSLTGSATTTYIRMSPNVWFFECKAAGGASAEAEREKKAQRQMESESQSWTSGWALVILILWWGLLRFSLNLR